jgi:hypothetical protein
VAPPFRAGGIGSLGDPWFATTNLGAGVHSFFKPFIMNILHHKINSTIAAEDVGNDKAFTPLQRC